MRDVDQALFCVIREICGQSLRLTLKRKMLECADPMAAHNFFTNKEGHLRSGWRLAIFAVAFIICVQLSQVLLFRAFALALNRSVINCRTAIGPLSPGMDLF